ncbi:hypothetical protein Tco_1516062 [Tanacetum coccineum]
MGGGLMGGRGCGGGNAGIWGSWCRDRVIVQIDGVVRMWESFEGGLYDQMIDWMGSSMQCVDGTRGVCIVRWGSIGDDMSDWGGDGDDTTSLAPVVSANEELMKLKQAVASLLEIPEGENINEVADDTGEKL